MFSGFMEREKRFPRPGDGATLDLRMVHGRKARLEIGEISPSTTLEFQ
jgi:hypothetical protein